jgi:hypothetical protein
VQKQAAPGNVPTVSQLYGGCKRIRTAEKCIALGNSREPPAETFLDRVDVEAKIREVASHAPKRLPSRRWEQTRLVNVPPQIEDEDDENEDDSCSDASPSSSANDTPLACLDERDQILQFR